MAKKNYNTIEDFLSDESFNNWVKANRLTDVDFWDEWIAYNPAKKELVYEAKDIILGLQFKRHTPSKDKIDDSWALLEGKIKAQQVEKPKKKSPNYLRFTGIAASILLLVSVGLYTFNNTANKIIYKTANGEVLNLKLKDGSTVTLNANSSLHYFENNHRKVWLKGEAFFEVDKKESTHAKFWVVTTDLNVEVYGTSFNVDTNHEQTAVFLEEGNIWLELKNGKTQKMVPGNYVSYSSKNNLMIENKAKHPEEVSNSWRNSATILFDKMLLKNAIKRIEETYNVTAVFKDEESKQKVITGGVPIANLEICLKAIEKSINVNIEKVGNQLIIRNKK